MQARVLGGLRVARLRELTPELAALATAVQQRPEPRTAALAQTPVSFLHGDWKLGDLGEHRWWTTPIPARGRRC